MVTMVVKGHGHGHDVLKGHGHDGFAYLRESVNLVGVVKSTCTEVCRTFATAECKAFHIRNALGFVAITYFNGLIS